MIKVIHHQFKQEWNKLDSNYYRDFTPLEIDNLLYRGLVNILQQYSTNESNQLFDDLISDYTVQNLSPISPVVRDDNTFEYKLPDNYLHWKSAYLIGKCKEISVDLVGLNEFGILKKDTLQKTSIKWGRVIGYIAKSYDQDTRSFYVKSEDNPGALKLIYIKVPRKNFFGGYDTVEFIYGDGPSSTDPPIDLETNNPASTNAIISEAVRLAKIEITQNV